MFITFEGIDGCGKSTHTKLLSDFLNQKGYKTLILREPGGTDFSEKIREILLTSDFNLNPEIELLLFEAARSHLTQNVIQKELESGTAVISDRYFDSTTAYQGYGRGINIDLIKICNYLATKGIKPDITFYLDLEIEEALSRSKDRILDNIEKSGNNFFEKVVEGYKKIADEEPERVIIINANGTIEETYNQIIAHINKKFFSNTSSNNNEK
ncbi:MAG: dTMP kinase [Candidatus Kapabacteria bacterium]|nr:dTMP kinase [Candidatus Kapabacteria bacterium]